MDPQGVYGKWLLPSFPCILVLFDVLGGVYYVDAGRKRERKGRLIKRREILMLSESSSKAQVAFDGSGPT